MAKGVNPKWIKARASEIEQGEFRSTMTGYNPAAQWIITFLSEKGIPCKMTHLGAGIKRITIAKNVCPTCKGRGFVDKEKSKKEAENA